MLNFVLQFPTLIIGKIITCSIRRAVVVSKHIQMFPPAYCNLPHSEKNHYNKIKTH